MRAYSIDLRERVLKAFDAGLPKSVIARTFGVGRTTVNNYIALRELTGDLAPKPIPGRPAYVGRDDRPSLVAQLERAPDATLAEHCQAWQQSHGVRLGVSAMHRTIARLGWTRKKRRSAPPSRIPSSASSGARK